MLLFQQGVERGLAVFARARHIADGIGRQRRIDGLAAFDFQCKPAQNRCRHIRRSMLLRPARLLIDALERGDRQFQLRQMPARLPQHLRIMLQRQRITLIEMRKIKAAALGVELQSQAARGHDLRIGIGQKRQQYLAAQHRIGRLPIHIEPGRITAALAPGQNVLPPTVGVAHAHMIGHDIDDQAHALRMQPFDQPAQRLLPAQFGIDARRIDRVVAVRGTGTGAKNRRCIKMADAELGVIIDQLGGLIQREALMQLQTGRGAGDAACFGHWVMLRSE